MISIAQTGLDQNFDFYSSSDHDGVIESNVPIMPWSNFAFDHFQKKIIVVDVNSHVPSMPWSPFLNSNSNAFGWNIKISGQLKFVQKLPNHFYKFTNNFWTMLV